MGPLLAYDTDGNIWAVLEHKVDIVDGNVVGLVDFEAHELAGGDHTDYWRVDIPDVVIKGSKHWPEWLGAQARHFRVELAGPPGQRRIGALVHHETGHRRERASIEAAIEATPIVNKQRDIRHIVGGPLRPLQLDATGHTAHQVNGPTARPALIGRTT